MACSSCAKKKANSYQDFKALETPPFRATDIFVYDIQSNEARKFTQTDWNPNVTNVLLFTPSMAAIRESGNITPQDGVQYTYATNQPLHEVKDYLENNDIAFGIDKIFISYLLPSRMGLLYNGFAKKAIAYIMKDGDMSVQQLFYNSTFNYNQIQEFLDDYTSGNN